MTNGFTYNNDYLDHIVLEYKNTLFRQPASNLPEIDRTNVKALEAHFFRTLLDKFTGIYPFFTERALTYIAGNLVIWLNENPHASKETLVKKFARFPCLNTLFDEAPDFSYENKARVLRQRYSFEHQNRIFAFQRTLTQLMDHVAIYMKSWEAAQASGTNAPKRTLHRK